jgi:N6-adenosine-specific RNA methylase IME4/ParB-like chromosome segregation protein Spo0J
VPKLLRRTARLLNQNLVWVTGLLEDFSNIVSENRIERGVEHHPISDLFPMMESPEFDALAADIKTRGQLRAIVTLDGKILDGRNRYRACLQANIPPRIEHYIGNDPLNYVVSSNLHRRHLDASQRAMIAARLETMRRGRPRKDANLHVSRDGIAQTLGVSPRSVADAVIVRKQGTPELIKAVDGGKIPVSVAAKVAALPTAEQAKAVAEPTRAKYITKAVRRAARELQLADATKRISTALGTKRYGVLYADPPTRFEPWSSETGMDRAADNHYPTMTEEELFAWVQELPAAENCALFLWRTGAMAHVMHRIMDTAGFTYRAECIWVKNKIGTGYWFRSQHEVLMLGVRGKISAPAPGTQLPSVIHAPVGRHSEKPDVFAEMIGRMFPNVPKLEMFARRCRAGWDVWGNECPMR